MQPSGDFKLQRATLADTQLIASLRLSALRDAPGAFLSRYEDCPELGHEDWRKVIAQWTRPPDNAVFVATHGDSGVGMCGAFVLTPVRMMLVAMWVIPEQRGSLVAGQLVERVFDFARGRGVADVAAWVVEDNHRALGFYHKHGFKLDGERQVFEPEPEKDELLMVRTL